MGVQSKSFEIDQLAKGVGYFIMLYGGAFQEVWNQIKLLYFNWRQNDIAKTLVETWNLYIILQHHL